ncbi:DUF4148 domain-containing protein [Spirosoma utsteinense]|uniref:Uncharacterized protein n=1 Tax=Spirosoma utsteinense TaxID=2585773 RepID=A0ABR6WD53_9BACT|nr:DUF4148 domain-containing protein [Spirosoma utsteinense]MBC3786433.1 hypothetical protein [Spirosoma utsteinense]MBC3793857.1 hypothetical protein [Spirosoma utsteinense]
MKRTLFFTTLLVAGLTAGAMAQSGQSPTMQQSTSTVETPGTNTPRPKIKKTSRRERMEMERGMDTTLPKDRKQRRLPPDSLRRGGATKVDTIR